MTQLIIMYIVLITGFILSYLIYTKFGIRAPGVIAAPLLALYTLENINALYIVGLSGMIIYIISQLLYKKWFIYGRKLFLIMCIFSIFCTAPLMNICNLNSIVFISILPAIFAYNITINGVKILPSIIVLLLEVIILVGIGMLL